MKAYQMKMKRDNRNATFIVALFILFLLMIVVARADNTTPVVTAPADDQFFATALAGTETAVVRVGYRPMDKVAIFGQGVWLRDLSGEQTEGYGFHFGTTYDIAEGPVKFVTYEIPVTFYVGAMAGAMKPETTGWQTSPVILSGFTFGSKSVRVVIEGWYAPGTSISDAFSEIDDKARLLVGCEFRI
jgi:hypothetical protein